MLRILYITQEALVLKPYDNTSSPFYYLTPQLLSVFEPGDKRFDSWVDSYFPELITITLTSINKMQDSQE